MPPHASGPDLVVSDPEFVETLKSHLLANPKDHDALVALGLILLTRHQPEKALDCFNKVSRADPRYPGIWRFKAKAFEALGDTASAEECRLRGSDPRS